MCMHTTDMHMQVYVCACILVSKNPHLSFMFLSFHFFYIICLCFDVFVCFLVFVPLFYYVLSFNMLDWGFFYFLL